MIYHFLYRLIPKSAIRVSRQKICFSCYLKAPRGSGHSAKPFDKVGNVGLDNSGNQSGSDVIRKCQELMHPSNLPDHDPVEIFYKTKFGVVRFDDDNRVYDGREEYDGKFSDENDNHYVDNEPKSVGFEVASPEHESNDQTLSTIDSQYFGTMSPSKPQAYEIPLSSSSSNLNLINDNHGFIDKAYFSSENPNKTDIIESKTSNNDEKIMTNTKAMSQIEKVISPNRSKLSDFEISLLDEDIGDEYCVGNVYKTNEFTKDIENTLIKNYKETQERTKSLRIERNKYNMDKNKLNINKVQGEETYEAIKENVNPHIPSREELHMTEDENSKNDSNSTIHSSSKRKQEVLGEESSALKYVKELRANQKLKELGELNEDGGLFIPIYKDIISRVQKIAGLSEVELKLLLHRSILYNDNDIVAIDKPYNLQMHEGSSNRARSGTESNVQQLLPMLCALTRSAQLFHIHRLDATTTGVLLFAKTEEMAYRLRTMFRSHEIIKTYLCITKKIPSYTQGTIDIPIKEDLVDGKNRMGLRPIIPDNPTKGNSKRAITKFKVLSACFNTALISVNPVSGVKHQVRAHLGLALKCPVLADHKYSLSHEIKPQKLNGDTLKRLEITQSRVRDLPMMLHASSIFLPKFVDGRNLKISCPPPSFFLKTVKVLKLNSRHNLNDEKNIETLDLGVKIVH